ncbi:hypothetical protein [Enhygromyxa salina]|uniref:hypothetical protein n=1 Tax=Enhygromyxa salina TaxID=215803 RepID=UPI0015E5BE99|nr:hypothetical protein [Enhygromyxa salina]
MSTEEDASSSVAAPPLIAVGAVCEAVNRLSLVSAGLLLRLALIRMLLLAAGPEPSRSDFRSPIGRSLSASNQPADGSIL